MGCKAAGIFFAGRHRGEGKGKGGSRGMQGRGSLVLGVVESFLLFLQIKRSSFFNFDGLARHSH